MSNHKKLQAFNILYKHLSTVLTVNIKTVNVFNLENLVCAITELCTFLNSWSVKMFEQYCTFILQSCCFIINTNHYLCIIMSVFWAYFNTMLNRLECLLFRCLSTNYIWLICTFLNDYWYIRLYFELKIVTVIFFLNPYTCN